METIEGLVNFVYYINSREHAQSQLCKHAEGVTNEIHEHHMLASRSITQMVSDKCHKRERQVNQSHASGSDNFNGAEEILSEILGYFVNGSKYLA